MVDGLVHVQRRRDWEAIQGQTAGSILATALAVLTSTGVPADLHCGPDACFQQLLDHCHDLQETELKLQAGLYPPHPLQIPAAKNLQSKPSLVGHLTVILRDGCV